MFIPDGSCSLFPSSSACINSLVSNRDHKIIAAATDTALYFYISNTNLLACVFQRDEMDVKDRGSFIKAYWKPDSTAICVTTSKNFLNIYSIEVCQTPPSFNLHDPTGGEEFIRKSTEFFLTKHSPQLNVNLAVVAKLQSSPRCSLSFKEELVLCLEDGWLHRLSWLGNVMPELSFNINSLINDQHPSKNSNSIASTFVVDIAPFLGGICTVFNDGRAAMLVSNTADFQPRSISILWANGLSDACCCSANIRFRLVYFGCKNGDIAGYSIDDSSGELIQLFRIHLAIKNGIEFLQELSSVRQISCLHPHGSAFSVIWDNKQQKEEMNGEITPDMAFGRQKCCPPTVAIFSPFGEQWWCSLEDNAGVAGFAGSFSSCLNFTTLDWGTDGYQLWLGTTNAGIQQINLIRSLPNSHDQLILVGADRIYLCPIDVCAQLSNQQIANFAPRLNWQLLKPPHNYINSNWPIKHAAISQNPDKMLAVAGSHGLCLYNFKTAKWRMFRKEIQEKSLLLTGGLAIFGNFLFCSACNLDAKSDESDRLYVFKMNEQLDLDLAQYTPTSRILLMRLSETFLITFDINSTVNIYALSNENPSQLPEMECVVEIRIAEFLPHPNCLISMELAKLDFHAEALPFCNDMDSLLVNVAGHLLLLSPMETQFNGQEKSSPEESVSEFQLHPPTLVASFVEEFWIIHPPRQRNLQENGNGKIPYLSEALWINAGCKKSRIWLPLSLEMHSKKSTSIKEQQRPQLMQQNSRTFISRRIMLPFAMDIYPLFIDSNYLACGANCISMQLKTAGSKVMADNVSLTSKLTENDSLSDFTILSRSDENVPTISVYSIVQTNEVFIHKLLKQLLKRNLGSYAFELASACRTVSYFGHILELLLHDILDEEATSSEPIPDPLLPTVVSFLHEFPDEYLQTIVHCARKTELAFWNMLFSASNHPRKLFQMCMKEGRLETATSCLVILHSLVSIQESSKLACQLLEETLTRRRWNIAKDIVRFTQNINRATERDSIDFENTPESPPVQGKLSTHHHPVTPFNSSTDEFNFPLFSTQIDIEPTTAPSFMQERRRSGSGKLSDTTHPKHIAAFATSASRRQKQPKPTIGSSFSQPNKEKKSLSPPPLNLKDQQQQKTQRERDLDDILIRHAFGLLEDFALRDLGAFSSYLPLDFVAFFQKPENSFSVDAKEFPVVLMKLHSQFNWPYPVAIAEHLPISQTNGRNAEIEGARNRLQNFTSDATHSSTPDEGSIADTMICDWKVLGNFPEHSAADKRSAQAASEISFVFDQLQKAEAFEWLYLLSILRRDIRLFKEQVLAKMGQLTDHEKRFKCFQSKVRDGTTELCLWAQARSPAYAPVMRIFKSLLE